MSDPVHWLLGRIVLDGAGGELRQLMYEMAEPTRQKEPGTSALLNPVFLPPLGDFIR